MEHPVEPLDAAILNEAVIETYQRQSDERRCKRERKLGDESNDVGGLEPVKR